MYDLAGQVALVTGGAQGIGRGIALELAQAGAAVVVADLDRPRTEVVVAEIQALRREAMALELDVTDCESVQRCVAAALARFPLHILVNNAGIHCERIGQASTVTNFKKCLDVNLIGIWRMTQVLVPHFKARGGGRIVNIASINGRKPWADTPAYSASKAGVINLTQSLAVNLGADQINVNAVCPGGVMTAMADRFKEQLPNIGEAIVRERVLKRALSPQDIGRAVVFLVSSQAKNITGQALNVDGGCVFN